MDDFLQNYIIPLKRRLFEIPFIEEGNNADWITKVETILSAALSTSFSQYDNTIIQTLFNFVLNNIKNEPIEF